MNLKEEKGGKRQVTKSKILFITLVMSLFVLFIYRKKKHKLMTGKKIHIEQTKNTVVFTHLPNKCHNIFTKHLFSVVVGHNFVVYYVILTYKKLTH